YTVYCNGPGKGNNYKLIDNRFSTKYVSTVGGYGPDDEGDDETAYGNDYYESGQPVAGIGAPDPQGTPTPTPPPSPAATPTPSPTATPTPTPSPSGWPDASNTGVPAGTTLTPSGSLTITQAGAVIDALDVTGSVTVDAPNVTIKRTRIRSNAFRVIDN